MFYFCFRPRGFWLRGIIYWETQSPNHKQTKSHREATSVPVPHICKYLISQLEGGRKGLADDLLWQDTTWSWLSRQGEQRFSGRSNSSRSFTAPAGGARIMVRCHYHHTIGLWWFLVLAKFLIGPFQISPCNGFFWYWKIGEMRKIQAASTQPMHPSTLDCQPCCCWQSLRPCLAHHKCIPRFSAWHRSECL